MNMPVAFIELTTNSETFQNFTLFRVSDDYTEVRNLISVIQVL
jgi:hypothetical protein